MGHLSWNGRGVDIFLTQKKNERNYFLGGVKKNHKYIHPIYVLFHWLLNDDDPVTAITVDDDRIFHTNESAP